MDVIESWEVARIEGCHPAAGLDDEQDRVVVDWHAVGALVIGLDNIAPV